MFWKYTSYVMQRYCIGLLRNIYFLDFLKKIVVWLLVNYKKNKKKSVTFSEMIWGVLYFCETKEDKKQEKQKNVTKAPFEIPKYRKIVTD